MSTASAATSAFRVSRSSAGGQSTHDELEALAQGLQRAPQPVLAVVERDQFDVGPQQVLVRRNHAEAGDLGGLECGFGRHLGTG